MPCIILSYNSYEFSVLLVDLVPASFNINGIILILGKLLLEFRVHYASKFGLTYMRLMPESPISTIADSCVNPVLSRIPIKYAI